MKKHLLFLACLVLSAIPYKWSFGQTPNVVPVSPEASALAKMVNYPVNLNTGIPDIKIPFYEINVGELKLPITLQYNAGGFRINEQATRAGLGWSLSSDLQITRTINGLDDMSPNGYINNSFVKAFYPNPAHCPGCGYPEIGQEFYWLANGDKDAAPDQFNYKLLNKSGSFYFRKNDSGTGYTIVPVPFDNITIQYTNRMFVITDTDGTVYHFGNPFVDSEDDYVGKGVETTTYLTDTHWTAWKCKRIVSNNGTDEITFNYAAKATVQHRTFSDRVEYYNNEDPCNLASGGYYTSNTSPMNNPTWDYPTLIGNIPFFRISSPKYMVIFGNGPESHFHVPHLNSSNEVVDRIYKRPENMSAGQPKTVAGLSVTEILFRGCKIQFSGVDQLSFIRVLDHQNTEVKSLHFYQSYTIPLYFTESKAYNGPNFLGTLYLDSLHVRNSSTTYERYALYYTNKFSYGNHLKGHDAWGYVNATTKEIAVANNTTGNILSLPTIDIIQPRYYRDLYGGCGNFAVNLPLIIGGNDWAEAPDKDLMKRGVLQRIVYPTGGFTDFDFEPNQYTEEFTGDGIESYLPQLSGGLRIRAINNYGVATFDPSYESH